MLVHAVGINYLRGGAALSLGVLFCPSDLIDTINMGGMFLPLYNLGFNQGSTTTMSDTEQGNYYRAGTLWVGGVWWWGWSPRRSAGTVFGKTSWA